MLLEAVSYVCVGMRVRASLRYVSTWVSVVRMQLISLCPARNCLESSVLDSLHSSRFRFSSFLAATCSSIVRPRLFRFSSSSGVSA